MSIIDFSTGEEADIKKVRVRGFVDGFNLYHALQDFSPSMPVRDPDRYRKYKWLCLTSLLRHYVLPKSEILSGVEYFTAYPNWPGSTSKKLRHEQYVSAQKQMGVHVTFGEFKAKEVTCQAGCRRTFQTNVEKQTDINLATRLIETADLYDKAIIVTADSDQVPTIKLLRRLYPDKRFSALPPIGRGAKDLIKACHEGLKMTEKQLQQSQLPSLIEIRREGKPSVFIAKPTTWLETPSIQLAAGGDELNEPR